MDKPEESKVYEGAEIGTEVLKQTETPKTPKYFVGKFIPLLDQDLFQIKKIKRKELTLRYIGKIEKVEKKTEEVNAGQPKA